MSPIRLILRILISMGIFCAVLFIPAGTIWWGRAWVLIGLSLLIAFLTMSRLPRELIEERMKPIFQKEQPLSDKLILIPFILTYLGFFVFISLDVFRLDIFPRPSGIISLLGLALFIWGNRVVYLTFRENSFAAPVVKHQKEREHKVVTTGVYAIVRHPMYAAIFPILVGMALWLESYAGALLAVVPMAFLALRIVFEEKFLKRELPGYAEYTQKVQYRLIPGLW